MKKNRSAAVADEPYRTEELRTTAQYALKAKRGQPQAMDDLVKRIEERLYRFCCYLTGNEQQAKDLAQEAYIRVLENIGSLGDPRRFVSWLFTVTRNHFLDYVRSPKNRPYRLLEDVTNGKLVLGPTNEVALELAQMLAGLESEDRYIILLVCLEGRSYEETAKITGLTLEAVRSRMYRARNALKAVENKP